MNHEQFVFSEFLVRQPATIAGDFRMKLHDIYLQVKRIKPYGEKLSRIEAKLASGQKCIYYYDNMVTRNWNIPVGTTSKRIENLLISNYKPHTIVAGLIDSDELQGDKTKSNYQFAHFNLSELFFTDGSGLTLPAEPFQPNFASRGEWMRCWISLFSPNGVPGLALKSDYGKNGVTSVDE